MSVLHWQRLSESGRELRPRHPFDFYPTNVEHVQTALSLIPITPDWVLDPGMGAGVWGRVARKCWSSANIIGVELRLDAPLMSAYDWNIRADFLKMNTMPMFDAVIGNPPYKYAEAFIRHSFELLRLGGYLVFLLRLSFLESLGRYTMFTREIPPERIVVCSDRPSFTDDGKTDASAYAFFQWRKGYSGPTTLDWVISQNRHEHHQYYQPSLFESPMCEKIG